MYTVTPVLSRLEFHSGTTVCQTLNVCDAQYVSRELNESCMNLFLCTLMYLTSNTV